MRRLVTVGLLFLFSAVCGCGNKSAQESQTSRNRIRDRSYAAYYKEEYESNKDFYELVWDYYFEEPPEPFNNSATVLGPDGSVYFWAELPDRDREASAWLYALDREGELSWCYETDGWILSEPVVGGDGTIYIGSNADCLYAINSDGSLKKKIEIKGIVEAPAIGPDGTLYVTGEDSNDGFLLAMTDEGIVKWRFEPDESVCSISSPCVACDGTIIFICGYYLYSLSPDGELIYKYEIGNTADCFPAPGRNGIVYAQNEDGALFAVDADGELMWRVDLGGHGYAGPVVGPDGTIYCPVTEVHDVYEGYLYAVDPRGDVKWRYKVDGWFESFPSIGQDGNIYVCEGGYLQCINPEGECRWKSPVYHGNGSSPAIDSEGVIYFRSYGHCIALKIEGCDGLADTPWPKMGGNNQNTGRAE